jgi:hypothetical protein
MSGSGDSPRPYGVAFSTSTCPDCGHCESFIVCSCGRVYDRRNFLELPLDPPEQQRWRRCPCGTGLVVSPCYSPPRICGDGDWIQTYTGRVFYPLDPRPQAVCLADIAHSLAQQCRYAGHSLVHYSVAQHCVLVSLHVPHGDAAWGLLHDAAEAYLLDLPRPVKQCVRGYGEAEERVLEAVAEHFGMTLPIPDSVHAADGQALATEQRDLMHGCDRRWALTEDRWARTIVPWDQVTAESAFVSRAGALGIKGADLARNDLMAKVPCLSCALMREGEMQGLFMACAGDHPIATDLRAGTGRCRYWEAREGA